MFVSYAKDDSVTKNGVAHTITEVARFCQHAKSRDVSINAFILYIKYITSITDQPEVVHAMKKEEYPKEIYTEMLAAKKPVKFQVDSGASVNVIPAELAPDEPLKRTTKILRMWNDTTLQSLGSCRIIIQNSKNGKKFSVEFLVVGKQLTPIIGARAAQQMGLITINEENFKIAQPPQQKRSAVKSLSTTEEIIKHHPEVFQRKLGMLPGTVHLEVDQNITPVVAPPRSVPASPKGQLKQELDRLARNRRYCSSR